MKSPVCVLVVGLKGGAGRSTVTAALARKLAASTQRPAVLDLDFCNPTQPELLNIHTRPQVRKGRMIPACDRGVGLFSIGGFLRPADLVLWTGSTASGALYQAVHDVAWQGYTHLLIDTPPGLTDLHLELAARFPDAITLHVLDARSPQNLDRERCFLDRLSLSANIDVFNFADEIRTDTYSLPTVAKGRPNCQTENSAYQLGIAALAHHVLDISPSAEPGTMRPR